MRERRYAAGIVAGAAVGAVAIGLSFLLAPVAIGALLLAAFALIWHNLVRRGSWPQRLW